MSSAKRRTCRIRDVGRACPTQRPLPTALVVLWLVLAPSLFALNGCEEEASSTAAPLPARSVLSPESASEAEEPKLSVLFVGNSLTFANDLPGMLEAMIDAAEAGPARVRSFTYPNFGLEDHWRQDEVRRAVAEGGWDVVVLQQGPSATEGRPSLLKYAVLFGDEAAQGGARIALYTVWPDSRRPFDFDGVRESYRLAAEQAGGLLFPVGDAWQLVWERAPEFELYGRDGFHPGPKATYLAAAVMFEQLTGRSPVGLPRTLKAAGGRTLKLSRSEAKLLQEVASEANEHFALP